MNKVVLTAFNKLMMCTYDIPHITDEIHLIMDSPSSKLMLPEEKNGNPPRMKRAVFELTPEYVTINQKPIRTYKMIDVY